MASIAAHVFVALVVFFVGIIAGSLLARSAHQVGHDDYRKGLQLLENPFPESSKSADRWHAAWMDAHPKKRIRAAATRQRRLDPMGYGHDRR